MNRPALLDFDEARRQLLELAQPLALREGDFEVLPTNDALDRVLARDQVSTLDVPPMDNSQMDGYAVRAADLVAGQPMAVSQRIAAGEVAAPLAAGTAARIFTGAMVPAGADAVIMQEQAVLDGGQVRFDILPAAGDWIRRAGEDIRRDSVVLTAGTRLTPQALGLAASVGLAMLPVRPRLRVACFFTGDELAMPGETLAPGAIYNSNRFVLVALLRRLGCDVTDLGIVPDSLDATRSALREAARRCDLIVTSGGMSVGEEDHVRPALEAEGSLRTWQIAIKPGKPLAWGAVRRADGGSAHFIGLPGNPVSSFVTFLLFVRPFILRLQGATDRLPRPIAVRADFDWPKPDRRREFLRVRFNQAGGLDLFANQGSGVLTSTVWADGLIDNPPLQAIRRGDLVAFLPMEGLL
jgi:molybdopterin molybdotransferase